MHEHGIFYLVVFMILFSDVLLSGAMPLRQLYIHLEFFSDLKHLLTPKIHSHLLPAFDVAAYEIGSDGTNCIELVQKCQLEPLLRTSSCISALNM